GSRRSSQPTRDEETPIDEHPARNDSSLEGVSRAVSCEQLRSKATDSNESLSQRSRVRRPLRWAASSGHASAARSAGRERDPRRLVGWGDGRDRRGTGSASRQCFLIAPSAPGRRKNESKRTLQRNSISPTVAINWRESKRVSRRGRDGSVRQKIWRA